MTLPQLYNSDFVQQHNYAVKLCKAHVALHLLDKETLRVQMLLEQISTKELFIGMKGAETPLHFDERENLFFQVLS